MAKRLKDAKILLTNNAAVCARFNVVLLRSNIAVLGLDHALEFLVLFFVLRFWYCLHHWQVVAEFIT